MEQHFVEEPCQEGWHRPVLSLFAKVFTVFSCKLPKVTCFQKFAFAKRCANASLPHGRQSRLITPPTKRNRAFPMGNALLYISLLSVALIASFTGSAILNDLFAICNSRLLPTNQIVNCEAGCVLFRGAPCFCFIVVGGTSNRITATPYRFLPAPARTTRWRCLRRALPQPDERTSNRVQHRASA